MMDLPGRQNLNPAPTRPVAMVNKMPGGGLNWSNSNSARRKMLAVSATSTPPPTVKPYNTSEFRLKLLLNETVPQAGGVLELHSLSVRLDVTDTLASSESWSNESVRQETAKHITRSCAQCGEIEVRH